MTERDNLIQRIWKALRPPSANPGQRAVSPRRATAAESRPVLVVVEGANDIEFLRRASVILHAADAALPVLSHLERRGRIVFVPFGGDPRNWIFRFAELGCPEFHLFDLEVPRQRKSAVNRLESSTFAPVAAPLLRPNEALKTTSIAMPFARPVASTCVSLTTMTSPISSQRDVSCATIRPTAGANCRREPVGDSETEPSHGSTRWPWIG